MMIAGGVAEWTNAAVLKTVWVLAAHLGSNPSSSAAVLESSG